MWYLAIPYIALCLLLVSCVCLAFRRFKWAAIGFFVLVLTNWYFHIFALHIGDHTESDLRVMSFNAAGHLSSKTEMEQLVTFVNEQDADIVFIAENYGNMHYEFVDTMRTQYPYISDVSKADGTIVFCKYPISQSEYISSDGSGSIAYGRVSVKGNEIKLFGVHFSSNNYNDELTYKTPDNVNGFETAFQYLKNIETASSYRICESDSIIKRLIPTDNAIVMGDFNDVYVSPALKRLMKFGLRDAWWEGGFGLGATIHKPLPFRIDHILVNNNLKVAAIRKVSARGISDHDALVADIKFE